MKHVSVQGRIAMLAAAAVLVLTAGPLRSVAATPKFKTGTVLKRTYEFKQAGKEMEYCLYVPKAYNKSKAWPLMVALHGLHSSAWQILHYPGLTEQAEKHGFIVVAPMGYNDRGWYGSLGWKMKRGSPENLGELSEKDVMNVLAITRRELNVDNRRIYLMGHSMGGGGDVASGAQVPCALGGPGADRAGDLPRPRGAYEDQGHARYRRPGRFGQTRAGRNGAALGGQDEAVEDGLQLH